IDQYMLRQTAQVAEQIVRWYDEFAFHKIYQRVNAFGVVELSAFYFDVLKDRLYISAPNSLARRAAQTAIWKIGEALVRLLAPVMSFTCEDVWQYRPKVPNRMESVHLSTFAGREDMQGRRAGDATQQAEDARTQRGGRA